MAGQGSEFTHFACFYEGEPLSLRIPLYEARMGLWPQCSGTQVDPLGGYIFLIRVWGYTQILNICFGSGNMAADYLDDRSRQQPRGKSG